jgi:hypothetical protein
MRLAPRQRTRTSKSSWAFRFLSFLFACLVLSAAAQSQQPAQQDVDYQPRSGDAWIDRQLADMNDYAARYPASFSDEVSRYYSVPRDYVEAMQQQPAWEPGDIFMACALAQRVAQPCRAVVREWSRDHAEGWAGVATRLQAKPGTAPYKELRKDIERTYERWARPLAK